MKVLSSRTEDIVVTQADYLKLLTEEIHSATVATIGTDGHPQTRVVDMMLCDERGVYFLTAKGKSFYTQLTEQGYIALSATKNKVAVSLRGRVRSIGDERLDEIFEKNPYMKSIYPGDTRRALEVFWLYEAQGEYFDISDPSRVKRDVITIGKAEQGSPTYCVSEKCNGCGKCAPVCPQKSIGIADNRAAIEEKRCLSCGLCAEVCPRGAIEKRNFK